MDAYYETVAWLYVLTLYPKNVEKLNQSHAASPIYFNVKIWNFKEHNYTRRGWIKFTSVLRIKFNMANWAILMQCNLFAFSPQKKVAYTSTEILCEIFSECLRGCLLKTSAVRGMDVCPLRAFTDKEEGFSDTDVRTFWCKKLWIFRNLCSVRMNKGRGKASADIFWEGGINLPRFSADAFYIRPPKNALYFWKIIIQLSVFVQQT